MVAMRLFELRRITTQKGVLFNDFLLSKGGNNKLRDVDTVAQG